MIDMAYLVQPKTQAERNQVVSIFDSFGFKIDWIAEHKDTMWYFWLGQKLVHPHNHDINLPTVMVSINKLYDLLNKL